ncbi:Galactosylgalactosylxylosylprotein 3-beta-glucuronosyltransferase P [Frankliniella fusca]|uniref:Galactosylgalactosylxylosylprotein 3-beta-glucuronosyltransferase n=1 Tax=Frankliniella fusca TaxID=407009 RepID=A0AAE1LCH7_9NEOP|nr:Galactosylgalactosylxylosylprotein 3-beta-glucuronosyltransferase P [Frankliniella fusca]
MVTASTPLHPAGPAGGPQQQQQQQQPSPPPSWGPWGHRLRALNSTRVHRMWLLMCAAGLLVLAQYRVSTLLAAVPAAASPPLATGRAAPDEQVAGVVVAGGHTPAPWPSSVTMDTLEEAVRLSVERLAQNDDMAAVLGARLLREVASHLQLHAPTSAPADCSQQCADVLPGRAVPPPGTDPIYVITPTYRRPEQLPELTRMAQTLLLVRAAHWLVIEDAKEPSKQIAQLLERSGLRFEHLTAAMPEQYKKKRGAKPKGVAQRNRALQWLRANATAGVFYFADDDNTYDVAIFDEVRITDGWEAVREAVLWRVERRSSVSVQIRSTKRVSMFPVGLCTKFGLSTPVVSSAGAFVGFYDGWIGGRKFPVDMAGFAVSVKFLHMRPKATMPYAPGFEEDGFLRSLAPFEPKEIELKADNCTKVMVWHTQTKANAPSPPLDMAKYNQTNLAVLKTIIV